MNDVELSKNNAKNKCSYPKLWLIDANIYMFRSWFHRSSCSEYIDNKNNEIHAVIGFLGFLYRFLSREKPTKVVLAFDESMKHSHRRQLYPAYKNNRKPAPKSLKYQFHLCRQFLKSLGIAQLSTPYYEADDIIGTLANFYRGKGFSINIITADKDLFQLINEGDFWWDYDKGNKMSKWDIHKKYKIYPEQFADLLAISGDKSDNVPGIPGIGTSTAAKLLKRFASLDNLIASIPEISKTKIRRSAYLQSLVSEHIDVIRLSKQLTEIVCDIPDIAEDSDKKQVADWQNTQLDVEAFKTLSSLLNLSQEQQQKWLKLKTEENVTQTG